MDRWENAVRRGAIEGLLHGKAWLFAGLGFIAVAAGATYQDLTFLIIAMVCFALAGMAWFATRRRRP